MRYEDLSRLSPWAQKQIADKLLAQQGGKQTESKRKANQKQTEQQTHSRQKYHNQPVDIGPLHFDSQKEARRYQELAAMLAAGQIRDLRMQVNFTLLEGYTALDGNRIRPIVYRADFTYYDADEHYVVEDVKSNATRTKVYGMKKKLMQEKFGIEVREV